MFDQNQAPEITERMQSVLNAVREHPFPPKEKTFFSVEGIIGHYEDPTSDLLRFFMSPDEGHDLGSLFLRAFFACLNIDCSDLRFDGIEAWARVQTKDRKFPDLLIRGRDWILVIENKIRAQNDNPLASYEKYARDHFYGWKTHLAILSPDGRASLEFPQWKAVTYEAYCKALKSEFAKFAFDRPISKWQVFAREFIVHLENKLYNPTMTITPEQTAFVEGDLRAIGDLKKLSDCYFKDLLYELSECLQTAAPGFLSQFYDPGWCLKSPITVIGELQIEFRFSTPAHESDNPRREFIIAAWVKGLTEAQLQRATDLFAGTPPEYDERGYWVGKRSFMKRSEVVEALSVLAKKLLELCGTEPPIFSPTEAVI